MYCLCVNVYYCHRVTTELQLTNISYHIIITKLTHFFNAFISLLYICFDQRSAHHQENQLYQYIIPYISLCVGGRLVCRVHPTYQSSSRHKHVEIDKYSKNKLCTKLVYLQDCKKAIHVNWLYRARLKFRHDIICVAISFFIRIWYLIYLLTAIGLSPGGSTHLHTNNT